MRVAAVDLGTNSTRLLVAEVEDGTVRETLHRETRITRRGEGVGDLTLTTVEAQVDRLASLPLAERRRLDGLHPERAPVIVAGALIVRELLGALDLPLIEVSEHDLLDGAALEAAI